MLDDCGEELRKKLQVRAFAAWERKGEGKGGLTKLLVASIPAAENRLETWGRSPGGLSEDQVQLKKAYTEFLRTWKKLNAAVRKGRDG